LGGRDKANVSWGTQFPAGLVRFWDLSSSNPVPMISSSDNSGWSRLVRLRRALFLAFVNVNDPA
jgi:hypothetical protein